MYELLSIDAGVSYCTKHLAFEWEITITGFETEEDEYPSIITSDSGKEETFEQAWASVNHAMADVDPDNWYSE